METSVGRDLVEKTIILVAAAGDASRFILPKIRDQLYDHCLHSNTVPLLLRQKSFATWPLPHTGFSVLASQLTFISTNLGSSFPVAVITGPNTKDAIAVHLKDNNQFGLSNITTIEQNSTSAFTADGTLLFWEDGKDYRAPNGMGGCIEATIDNDWFKEQIKGGREYIYVWYVNDITSGHHIIKHLSYFAASGSQSVWLSGPKEMDLVQRIADPGNLRERTRLIHELEDSSGAYIFHHQMARELVQNADAHVVKGNLPIVTPDGSFLCGYKREIFLCDYLWKQQIKQVVQSQDTGCSSISVPLGTGIRSPSRVGQYFMNISYENILQALNTGTAIEIHRDLGIKKAGENLIGEWWVESVIKEGGMSSVYICRSEQSREKVIVKTYKEKDRWLNPKVKAQFRREILTSIAFVPHPHIVEALKVHEIDGTLYIFQEFMEGGNLRRWMQQGLVTEPRAILIGIQICEALQEIHDQGFLHKDIKPENVLFDQNGHVKLGDFGVSASFFGEDLREVAGTIYYMGPEFFYHGNITTAADMYSLGVMLYEMLTGTVPFIGTRSEIEHQHISVLPIPLYDRVPGLDDELADIVLTCLTKTPDERHQSIEILLHRLKSCYHRFVGKEYEPVTLTESNVSETIRLGRKRMWAYHLLERDKDAADICENLRQAFPENLAIAADQAFLFYNSDKFTECVTTCLQIMSPTSVVEPEILSRADMLLEMCSIQLGKKEAFIEAHTKWIELATQLATTQGDTRGALAIVELAIKIDPDCYPALIMKGQLLYELGDFANAIDMLRKGLVSTLDSLHPGLSKSALKTLEKCELLLNREISQTSSPSCLTNSNLEAKAVDLDEEPSQANLGEAENLARIRCMNAVVLLTEKKYEESFAEFTQTLQDQPDFAGAYMGRGQCYYEMGRFLEALDDLTTSIHLIPDRAEIYISRGKTYGKLGRYLEALTDYEDAIRLDAQSASAYYYRGNIYYAINQYEQALTDYSQALQINPSILLAYVNRANTYDNLGRNEEALADYIETLRLDPNFSLAYFNMGVLHAKANELEKALFYFEKAGSLGHIAGKEAAVQIRQTLGKKQRGIFSRLFGKK